MHTCQVQILQRQVGRYPYCIILDSKPASILATSSPELWSSTSTPVEQIVKSVKRAMLRIMLAKGDAMSAWHKQRLGTREQQLDCTVLLCFGED